MYKVNLFIKRLFDIVSSGLLALILTPLWIIVAIWIKTDSKGPVFFKQGRRTKQNINQPELFFYGHPEIAEQNQA